MATVTLIKGNPKRKHYRRHNPNMLKQASSSLPKWGEALSAAGGFAAALAIPQAFIRSTGWMRVVGALAVTAIGAVALRKPLGSGNSNAFALGGGLVVVAQSAYMLSSGAWGIPTTLKVAPSLSMPTASSAPPVLPASAPAGTAGVGAFRETQYEDQSDLTPALA